MAEKYMNELTSVELRYECSQRGLTEGDQLETTRTLVRRTTLCKSCHGHDQSGPWYNKRGTAIGVKHAS